MPQVAAAIGATINAIQLAIANAALAAGASLGTAVAIVNTVTYAALGAAATFASNALARAFAPGMDSYDPYANQRVEFVSNPPQRFTFGTAKLGGAVVYASRRDDDTGTYTGHTDVYVIALGYSYHLGMRAIWIDDIRYPVSGSGTGPYTIGGRYGPFLKVWFYNGTPGQAANQTIINASNGEWTADHRMRSICYAVFEWERADDEALNQGIPFNRTQVELDGILHYDPRKDSTVAGGSGTHRIDDPTSWEWSDNPALLWFTYQRGIVVNGKAVFGRRYAEGYAPTRYLQDMIPSVMAAADVCDEPVAVAGGGTIRRYRADMTVSHQTNHAGIEELLVSAMAGMQVESAGKKEIFAGHAAAPIATLTDELYAIRPPVIRQLLAPASEMINVALGTYTEPREGFKAADIPPYENTGWIAEDGNRIERGLRFPQIYDHRQAQRLCKIQARRSRLGLTVEWAVPIERTELRPGRVVVITERALGWSGRRFRIVERRLSVDPEKPQDLCAVLTAVEEPASLWDWSASEEKPREVSTPNDSSTGAPVTGGGSGGGAGGSTDSPTLIHHK